VKVKQIMDLVPRAELARLAAHLGVDYQVKKLDGATVFQLILFSLLNSNRVSLRVMEAFYTDTSFQLMAEVDSGENTRFNSIRDRICRIPSAYFEKLFYRVYERFEGYLADGKHFNLLRVDSTMVAVSAKLLDWGMQVGPNKEIKHIKFTIGLKGFLPESVQVFSSQEALSEDITLRQAIVNSLHSKESIVVFDRGLQSRSTFCELDDSHIGFVCRMKGKVKHRVVADNPIEEKQDENLLIETDHWVHLYAKGKRVRQAFRLIGATLKKNQTSIIFLTNIQELSALEIAAIYKQRWDIEIFFKFLKQELNLSHLVCRQQNGIEVMLYMTLIAAILLIVYKEKNQIKSYKIAKIRFVQELELEVMKQIVVLCGGDPEKLYEKFKDT
jgi:hypothetical protein